MFFTCLPFNNNPKTTTLSSVSSSSVLDSDDSSSSNLLSCSTDDDNDDVRIVAVVGEGAVSPVKSASWTNVLLHISPTLEEFSLCVLQKHNCLDLDAKIPEKPFVPPMVKFHEKILSHEIAEDLFVGWLRNLDWSWRVVAGQNPAYDQFPIVVKYQLFFSIGRLLLQKPYLAFTPMTTVDVFEDFSWGLFHYSGVARVAGQSYTGAVLVSPNGEYQNETEKERLVSALDRCCIKEWELFDVDNCQCNDPPLGLPEGSRFTTRLTAIPSDILGDSPATSR
ncbi:violaxanthin de-epoxidase, chloroplastic [Tanacetum coccineum]|uniref:Violaxanthin de-epoxidase, chloroplastic n=1 Tax=Tanacetum coccineum TaxID=301880 RepID=A0ABQ5GW96_9ASTR